jgi:hypothetical protein
MSEMPPQISLSGILARPDEPYDPVVADLFVLVYLCLARKSGRWIPSLNSKLGIASLEFLASTTIIRNLTFLHDEPQLAPL